MNTSTTIEIDPLRRKLEDFGQQHLVQFWNELSDEQKSHLSQQIDSIDFDLIATLASKMQEEQVWAELARKAEPPNAIRLNQAGSFSRRDAINAGEKALADGKVGMVLVAGGQGTRLGFDAPKGMLQLGPISKRTLFQIHFDKVIALGRHFGPPIPFFVMTSPPTHQQSIEFIQRQDRFGMPAEDLQIFCQGTMPAVDVETGKILLESKGQVFTAPNGHGGTISALEENGCLEKMKQRGIEHIFYCQVDNPMVQICDPLTIGYHILQNSDLTTQACRKREALQKVGNIVEVDGRVRIIEYSDLPEEIATQTLDDDSLKLWAGNIAVHVFRVDFLCRTVGHAAALPFHLARKKVPFVDERGNDVHPQQPNAIKFERFIFDLLPMADNALVVEVEAESAFAPVKNAEGSQSETATTAQAAMINQARSWLRTAGVRVDDSIEVEISPLFAVSAEHLAEKLGCVTAIEKPTFFQ